MQHRYPEVTKPQEPAWNVYKATCPTRQVLACIADKWAVLLIGALLDGTRRSGELRAMVEGISQKMLAQTLRSLERDGLVKRDVFAGVPPRVEYSLTPLGRSLAAIVEDLRFWSEGNNQEVLTSRNQFDARSGSATPSP